ncbi:MAG: hypothetical protein Fur0010_17470 [Bdellovibrio sp.]
MLKFFILLNLFLSTSFAQDLRERIVESAENFEANLDRTTLYGEVFRSPITRDGKLACARVVQILLKQAGLPDFQEPLYLVNQIQHFTKDWETISLDQVEAGDIIFWKRRFSNNTCKGGGDCHVGVAVNSVQSVDNKGKYKRPTISKINRRLGWKFLFAKRPPENL